MNFNSTNSKLINTPIIAEMEDIPTTLHNRLVWLKYAFSLKPVLTLKFNVDLKYVEHSVVKKICSKRPALDEQGSGT